MLTSEKLIEAIEDAGYEARSYSGRGMYGKCCVGVEINREREAFTLGAKVDCPLMCSDSLAAPKDPPGAFSSEELTK